MRINEWREIPNKVKTYQLGYDPELIHVIKHRDKFMVLFQSAYDVDTGKVEYYTEEQLKQTFGIEL